MLIMETMFCRNFQPCVSLAPQCCHTTEMKVFSYHSVAVTVKLLFLLLQDFESVSSDCTDAVRGAFHQLKELAESQGNAEIY